MSQRSTFTSPGFIAALCIIPLIVLAVIFLTNRNNDQPSKAPAAKTQNIQQATDDTQKASVHVEALPGATMTADRLLPLGNSISSYLNSHDPGSSVYLEDLNAKVTLHVGETKAYNIKSLMKVPLVMSLYKAGELGRLNLDEKFALTPSQIDKDFGDLWQKQAGYQLTLREAAAYALQASDNTAIRFINDHVFSVMQSEERAYKVIKFDNRVDSKGESYVSTQSYSTVFRCLYTACYINQQDSDEMLGLMKRSLFKAPMKLLPENVAVAHKIGNVGPQGYNDCGIVYGPKTPYMFCIMLSKGQPQADGDIAQITRMAYDYLEQ